VKEINEKAEFYRCSAEESRKNEQFEGWRESHEANIACHRHIDSHETGLERLAYKDYRVDADRSYSKGLIEKFGWQRTMCVLASTIKHADWDGRYSAENKEWAKNWLGYMNPEQTKDYRIISTHPGLTDILTNHIREEYGALGLYTAEHCEENSFRDLDYKNRILIIRPENLTESYWQPENQIFYADMGGFGCSLTARDRAVIGQYLFDGEKNSLNRADFIGIMKDEFVPDWAREKLERINQQKQERMNPPEQSATEQEMEMNM
jgi:hypothetical protein